MNKSYIRTYFDCVKNTEPLGGFIYNLALIYETLLDVPKGSVDIVNVDMAQVVLSVVEVIKVGFCLFGL